MAKIPNKRNEFRQIKQKTGQSIEEFFVELKKAASRCEFASNEEAGFDQFVNNLLDKKLKFEIFRNKTKTFQSPIEVVSETENAYKSVSSKRVATLFRELRVQIPMPSFCFAFGVYIERGMTSSGGGTRT